MLSSILSTHLLRLINVQQDKFYIQSVLTTINAAHSKKGNHYTDLLTKFMQFQIVQIKIADNAE